MTGSEELDMGLFYSVIYPISAEIFHSPTSTASSTQSQAGRFLRAGRKALSELIKARNVLTSEAFRVGLLG